MSWIPHFILYDTDGTTLVYNFSVPGTSFISYTNIPQSNKKNTIISGKRGKGCIVLEGSEPEWDAILRGNIIGTDFENITSKIDAMESAIPALTPFILVFEKTSGSSYAYNVKRIEKIEYSESLRNDYQEFTIHFLANAW